MTEDKLFKEMSYYKSKCVDLMCRCDELKKEREELLVFVNSFVEVSYDIKIMKQALREKLSGGKNE